jgi:hypothetical protein
MVQKSKHAPKGGKSEAPEKDAFAPPETHPNFLAATTRPDNQNRCGEPHHRNGEPESQRRTWWNHQGQFYVSMPGHPRLLRFVATGGCCGLAQQRPQILECVKGNCGSLGPLKKTRGLSG